MARLLCLMALHEVADSATRRVERALARCPLQQNGAARLDEGVPDPPRLRGRHLRELVL